MSSGGKRVNPSTAGSTPALFINVIKGGEKLSNMNKADFVSINKAALLLDLSSQTLTRWYRWWENDAFNKPEDLYLPNYYYLDRRKTKHFKKEELHYLSEFGEKLNTTHKGAMSEFNAVYQWGARGVKALKKKGIVDETFKKVGK